MQTVAVNGSARTALGKKSAKSARREGAIPCVMYGGNENIHFTTTLKDVKSLIFTPEFKVAEVNVDGATHRCIVKDVQYHPVKDTIRHIDFLKLIDGRPVQLELPVRFVGTSPGVKGGGSLIQNLRRVKVKTTPEKMIDVLTLDISELQLGFSIRIRDIQPEEGVEIINPPGTPVASVEVPRALRSAEAGAAAEGEEEAAEEAATEE